MPGGFRRFWAVSDGSDFEPSRSELGPWLVQVGPGPAVPGGFWRFRGPTVRSRICRWKVHFHWFFQCFLNIVIFEQMTVQDTFLVQLDRIWAPKRVPKGAQDEPKTDPRRVQNRVQNRSEKMIEKWTAQGSMAGIDGGHARPQVPTGGSGDGPALDRLVAPNRAANPQEKELPIKAPPPLPPSREERQRQASAGAVSQVSQSGLLLEGTQGHLKEGWLSIALGAYIDQQGARPGVREHFMDIGRLFVEYYKRQWMFQEYQPVEGLSLIHI